MNLPIRTYYYKPKKKPSEKVLLERMEQICLDFPKYGYRRVTEQLKREGWLINHKKVLRIMHEKGWLCQPRKKKWIHIPGGGFGCLFPQSDRICDLTQY